MENRNELLAQLGYSEEYLKMLSEESIEINSQVASVSDSKSTSQIIDNKVTSFIIEKTEVPINNHFVYNEGN